MKYKIVVDSSSNLLSNHICDSEVGFSVVPLTIRINGTEYVDDDKVDCALILDENEKSKDVPSSSCPSPNDFLKEYDAEYTICITITSKLSGCFNSARVAKDMTEKPENIFVIDSKATAGWMRLMVDEAYRLIKSGLEFEEITKKLTEYRDSLNLLFVLDKFDNLVKNGRMNKLVAFVAQMIAIKPLCYADDGEIKIKEKIRTFKGVLKRLVANIGKVCTDTKDRVLVISHTENIEAANELKSMIEEQYNFKEIIIEENRGLCSFYSLRGGLIVCF